MRQLSLTLRIAFACVIATVGVHAVNIVVDSDFSTNFGGSWSGNSYFGGANLANGTGAATGGAQIYDDGWINCDDRWEITNGTAKRTDESPWNYGGFAQMFTNPLNGDFDSNDMVGFSFDYLFNGGANGAFAGAIYGITAPNGIDATWNLFSGESVQMGYGNDVIITKDYTSGADYQFYCLNYHFDDTESATPESYNSGWFELDREYALFSVMFVGYPFGTGYDITVSNVVFREIPEPGAALALAVAGLALIRRRR